MTNSDSDATVIPFHANGYDECRGNAGEAPMGILVPFPGTKPESIKAEKRPYGLTARNVFVHLDLEAITTDTDRLRHAGECLKALGGSFIASADRDELPDKIGVHRAVYRCKRHMRKPEPRPLLTPA